VQNCEDKKGGGITMCLDKFAQKYSGKQWKYSGKQGEKFFVTLSLSLSRIALILIESITRSII